MKILRASLIHTLALCFGLFFSILSAHAQLDGIVIWDFETAEGRQTQLTETLGRKVSRCLSQYRELKVVDRASLTFLADMQENECRILADEGKNLDLCADLKAGLEKEGAKYIVIGEIDFQPYSGLYTLVIKVANIFTSQIIYEDEASIEEKDINKPRAIDKAIEEVCPGLDPFKGTQTAYQYLIDVSFLEEHPNPWPYFKPLYFEDFTDRHREGFLSYVWNLRDNDAYGCKVNEEEKCYMFEVKRNSFTGFKFIESAELNYTKANLPLPYSMQVTLNAENGCPAGQVCYGRGITVRYDKEKKSGYAFTLNDRGELTFFRFANYKQVSTYHPLFSREISVEAGKTYELGVISIEDRYYLFLNRERIQVVEDGTYRTGFNGVMASGMGIHLMDDIGIYQPTYVP